MSYVAKPAGYFISCACILALCDPAVASGAAEVEHAQQASIVVNADSVIRDHLPPTLFGFNVQHYNFQNDLWDEEKRAAADSILSAMTFFPGAIYRYPGGLVANRFQWKETIGPVPERGLQKVVKSGPARRVLFGVEEFLQFVESVGGQPWYVLNLAGWDTESMFRELPEQTMTESNAELAKLMKASLGTVPRYYQLGNELDRAEYQWPHDKYVQRARSTMAAIQAIDPDARFVAFLRDFDWKYKGGAGNGSVSGYEQFIADVLQGLPSVNNFSLHFYYDDPGMAEKYKQIPWRLNQFQRAIDAASRHREGRRPNVWITEHARGGNLAAGKLMERARFTSNLAAAISTSDFLISLAQMPEVQGAVWHGLNAGPWQLFDATTRYNDLRPRPIYWGMRVLRAIDLPVVLETKTRSPNLSKYAGGYDVRAVAFADERRQTLGLWVVNRASKETMVELTLASWKNQPVEMRHYYLSGEAGVDPDDLRVTPETELDPRISSGEFSSAGSIHIELPPASVSSFLMTRVESDAVMGPSHE